MEKQEPRRCTAKTKRGPCKRAPIRGGTVCPTHGGSAPQVRRKANERLADLIDPNRVLRETAQIAYSDLREVFDDQGRVKPINQWPAHVAATIAAVEVVKRNVYSNDDQVDDVIKIKVWDKPKALEMLGRHLSLFKDQIEVNVTGVVEARLHAARERLAKAKRG